MRITEKYAEREERVKEQIEARRLEAARMETKTAEATGIDRPAAWGFFWLRYRGRRQVDVEQNADADGITTSSEDERRRQGALGKF